MPPGQARLRGTVTLQRTVLELRGEACVGLETQPPCRRTACSSRTFAEATDRRADVEEAVAGFAAAASAKLRREGLVAGLAPGVRRHRPLPRRPAAVRERGHGESDDADGRPGRVRRRRAAGTGPPLAAGVRLPPGRRAADGPRARRTRGSSGCSTPRPPRIPSAPMPSQAAPRRERLAAAVDAANARFGRDTVRLGACAPAPRADAEQVHQTRRAMLSPCYTTRWNELPVARA